MDDLAEILFQSFLHGQGCPLFDVVHPAFPLWTTASPTGFRLFDNCQKRFLWTHKEVDLALQPVLGLVLQVGHVDKLPPALGVQFVVS